MDRSKMVYDWEPHRQTCYSLFIEQRKSLDDVIDYMRAAHSFSASRRAYQVQFKRWGFPPKHKRAWKNDELVARVRELWERNLTQKEMLSVLEAEGYELEARELVSLRTKHKMRLRETVGAFGGLREKSTEDSEEETDSSASDEGSEGEDEDDDDDGHDESTMSVDSYAVATGHQSQSPAVPPPPVGLTPAQMARKEERRRALEAESRDRYATKKRRRRTKAYAGLPADPPGPPRFPSEMTLEESKTALQLENDAYKMVRQKFQSICEEAGVIKKTIAGPEKWEAIKNQLVRDSMHLRAVMWDQDNMDQKRLAIDIIACDVTKRMRVASSAMTIAQAKTILGLNPEQGREIRGSLYKILMEDQFTCRHEEGSEHWEELKGKWLAGSELLGRLAAPTGSEEDQRRMTKAIDLLARDVMRRYRDDQNKKANKPPDDPDKPKPPPKRRGKAKPPATFGVVYGPTPSSGFAPEPNPKGKKQPGTKPATSTRRSQRGQPPPEPVLHTQSRLLPPSGIEQPQPDLSAMDAELGASLLLASGSQNPFVDDQYVQGYTAAHSHTHVHNVHDAQAAPIYHHQPPPPPPPPPPQPTTTIAVYFRLHPASTVFPSATPMWISTLSARSIDVLRSTAVEKFTDLLCMAIEGVIKDGKGGELPLPINDDAELETYLQHLQGMGAGAPTFSVQLVAGQRDWV
ncbi:hypothetical protein B0T25DRAFT_635629 [Lasiosphaeria hispida]|uniref:Clr5 domain-containing protein n=1 Tax=Lasiosphaeria hispida TaxID=260671 RepID=A0AAJ0H6D3_9PEZI|nr:hypothetical protein B0T25DRAFT_635629 [Lasiosphaeria hispida]